jgi:transposase
MPASILTDLDMLDLEAVKALVRTQHEQLSSRASEIAHLKLLLDKLQRMLFGAKSEKIVRQVAQLELQLEELEACRGEEELAAPLLAEEVALQRLAPVVRHDVLFRNICLAKSRRIVPRQVAAQDAAALCAEFGEDVSEILEYIPESFKVIRHVRPKFSCGRCERVVEASAPSRPIPRSYAGPGLLAHVLVSKFADHTPLHRQSEIYAREGIDLDRSTLAGWVGASSALLAPLVDALRSHVLAASKVHADDTPVPVLAPGNGKTKTGRLWTYVRDGRPCGDAAPPAAWFAFSPDRRGEHPQGHLKSFRGTLQADAYAGFHPLYEGSRILEAACRVDEDVAALVPHRPGRADFPHPVPHGRDSLPTTY